MCQIATDLSNSSGGDKISATASSIRDIFGATTGIELEKLFSGFVYIETKQNLDRDR